MPHVGDHVVVLDPHLARWLAEPTGTIMEVRCDGGHVKVEHDGSLSADLYRCAKAEEWPTGWCSKSGWDWEFWGALNIGEDL